MKIKLLASMMVLFCTFPGIAQEGSRSPSSGQFSLGVRNTFSVFGRENSGMGYGGHFRLRVAERLNTEWYADYITSNINDFGNRVDGHIGWSVMFDLAGPEAKLVPYLVGGHCFDYTKINSYFAPEIEETQDRWSSAVHLGIGSMYRFNKLVNAGITAQYMNHLGNDLSHSVQEDGGSKHLHVESVKGVSLEGHVLISASVNVLITDLWK